ncbi:unnamed protein product [Closterium sp. Yama58-4]|nr:unnamed protein product [Closterium sp. Yama58-4]
MLKGMCLCVSSSSRVHKQQRSGIQRVGMWGGVGFVEGSSRGAGGSSEAGVVWEGRMQQQQQQQQQRGEGMRGQLKTAERPVAAAAGSAHAAGLAQGAQSLQATAAESPYQHEQQQQQNECDKMGGSSSSAGLDRPSWVLAAARPFTEHREFTLDRGPLDLAEADCSRSLDDMPLLQVVRLQQLYRRCCNDREATRILVKIHQRVALPCATFLFAILGALFAAQLQIRKRQVGFALAVFVIFTYYSLSVTGALLAQLHVISPLLGGWLPNLVGASLALVLLRLGDNVQ